MKIFKFIFDTAKYNVNFQIRKGNKNDEFDAAKR